MPLILFSYTAEKRIGHFDTGSPFLYFEGGSCIPIIHNVEYAAKNKQEFPALRRIDTGHPWLLN